MRFTTLYDEFSGLVYSVALRMLRTPAAAEDATQDIWVKIWNAAATYDSRRAAVSTWIIVITRRHVLDVLRREKVRAAGKPGIDPQDDADALAISSPDDVAHEAELQELSAEVRGRPGAAPVRAAPRARARLPRWTHPAGDRRRAPKTARHREDVQFQGMRTMRTLLDDPPPHDAQTRSRRPRRSARATRAVRAWRTRGCRADATRGGAAARSRACRRTRRPRAHELRAHRGAAAARAVAGAAFPRARLDRGRRRSRGPHDPGAADRRGRAAPELA